MRMPRGQVTTIDSKRNAEEKGESMGGEAVVVPIKDCRKYSKNRVQQPSLLSVLAGQRH